MAYTPGCTRCTSNHGSAAGTCWYCAHAGRGSFWHHSGLGDWAKAAAERAIRMTKVRKAGEVSHSELGVIRTSRIFQNDLEVPLQPSKNTLFCIQTPTLRKF